MCDRITININIFVPDYKYREVINHSSCLSKSKRKLSCFDREKDYITDAQEKYRIFLFVYLLQVIIIFNVELIFSSFQ